MYLYLLGPKSTVRALGVFPCESCKNSTNWRNNAGPKPKGEGQQINSHTKTAWSLIAGLSVSSFQVGSDMGKVCQNNDINNPGTGTGGVGLGGSTTSMTSLLVGGGK
jgi:hypothetical protein